MGLLELTQVLDALCDGSLAGGLDIGRMAVVARRFPACPLWVLRLGRWEKQGV